uniref:Uncharacterized protein n=1 Tax=Arundo donax TaxID=35708 RepID=A0A0A9FSM0_ARUDO
MSTIIGTIRKSFITLYVKNKSSNEVYFSRAYCFHKNRDSNEITSNYSIEHPHRNFFFFFSLSLVGGWITTLRQHQTQL